MSAWLTWCALTVVRA